MISIGVIGCGDIGRILIRTLSTIPTCQLKAICDQNEKKLKADPSGAPLAYRALDYNTLLGDRELRAIAIATPTHSCFPLAKNALLAGKQYVQDEPMNFGLLGAVQASSSLHPKVE